MARSLPTSMPTRCCIFIRTVGLGLLVQRAVGAKPPDAAGWDELIGRVLASIGASRPDDDSDPTTSDPTTADPTFAHLNQECR